MKIENRTCRDGKPVDDSPLGQHHEKLHEIIEELRRALKRIQEHPTDSQQDVFHRNEALKSVEKHLK